MKINKYPDGTSYVIVNQEKVITTFKINTYEDLHHLEQFVEAYNSDYNEQPTIIIPNLIDAQADTRFGSNQSFGLSIILKRLANMDAHFKIFHPHNPGVVSMGMLLLKNPVEIIDNSEFIMTIIESFKKEYFKEDYQPHISQSDILYNNLILMSADAGGYKPLMKLCDKINWQGETYSASKSRGYMDGKSKLTQLIDREDFGGKDILIVDDISVYGGTFKGLSKLLRERNVGKLYLTVSHMTVQNLGEDPVTNYFDKVFTTNSKFDSYETLISITDEDGDVVDNKMRQPENLDIIKMF